MAMKSSSGRSSTEGHVVIQSSIVLLQERFRQLQREKELREKRDLLKMFISSSPVPHHDQHLHDPTTYHNRGSITSNATTTSSPTRATNTPTTATMQYNCEPLLFFHPDLIFPAPHHSISKPSSQQQQQQHLVSLSLWPTSHTKQQQQRQESHDHQLLLTMDQTSLPSTLVSHAPTRSNDNYHKYDDNSVSDVDTSLHL